jgi:penicillin-binding protein 1A
MSEDRRELLHIPEQMRPGAGDASPVFLANPRNQGWFSRLFALLIFFAVSGTILGGMGALFLFQKYARQIPVFNSLDKFRPDLPSSFYSKGEMLIGEFYKQRREVVPIEKIPRKLLYAFVAAEDDRFFKHGGVDPVGITRAMIKNLKNGRIKAGGSTLTQQVAKSFLYDLLQVTMRKNVCRNDSQCGWRERCQARAGSAIGRCVARSFKSCSSQVTTIYNGRPVKIYRGLTTLCDPHEVCLAQCKTKEQITSGQCAKWTCMPAAAKPVCTSDDACGFGKKCVKQECVPDFNRQVSMMINRIQDKGAEIRIVKAPEPVMSKLSGDFKRRKSKYVKLYFRNAINVNVQKIEGLPGVLSTYRYAEKTLRRKIREAVLATSMERKFTKKDILWLYLNQVFLGHKAHGVQAASQNYFGKNVWELNLKEAAILAGLPQAPSRYNPHRHPKRALKRMGYVLRRMEKMGYISRDERMKALKRKLVTYPVVDVMRKRVPYFAQEVKKIIQRKYGKESLNRDGLEVFTTVDVEKQMLARLAIRKGLENLDKRQGYRGPLGVIPRKNWADANRRAAKYYGNTPIKPGQTYAGLVMRINRSRQYAVVQIGKHTGYLPLAGMRWARKPSPYRRRPIWSVRQALKPGYWILVEPRTRKQLKTGSRSIDRKIPNKPLLLRLRQHPKVEGAVLSMDPHSGYVDAMVGGYAFERSEFNRALYACRQPGSSFKPLVYATALENGETIKKRRGEIKKPITTGTVLVDAPLIHDSNSDPKAARYKPGNHSGTYAGEVTLRTALMNSMNIPAIKTMMKVGVDKVIEYARKFGITTHLRKELGLALGQSCVKPWDLMKAYGVIARGGVKANPTLIRMVIDRDQQVLEDHRNFDDPAMSPESKINRMEAKVFEEDVRILRKETAYLITYLMRGVVLYTTGYKVRQLKKPAAGKTGTTNDSFDVWFMGITKKHVTGVWLGFDKNEQPLGAWETGGRTAAPVWLDYMKKSTAGLKWSEWTAPSTIVWKMIDPKTGKLAAPGASNALKLPFEKGTEPKERARSRSQLGTDDID